MADTATIDPATPRLEGDPPAAPGTPAQGRARFFSSANAFNLKLAAVPRARFDREVAAARDPASGTGLYPMDQSPTLGCGFPATTPLVLARYARIAAGDTLETAFRASGEVHYVIEGSGETRIGNETIAWRTGDVMALPGGHAVRHTAGDMPSVLWIVTNEPALAFEKLSPPEPGTAAIEAVHYPAAEIDRQIEVLLEQSVADDQAGVALIFASERTADSRNVMPSLTLAFNTLQPGTHQRAHKHNSAAITLCVDGEDCFSMIDGERIIWSPYATMVTPPGEVHSHHNAGDRLARFLIVQDGGWHYHARTMGFEFAE